MLPSDLSFTNAYVSFGLTVRARFERRVQGVVVQAKAKVLPLLSVVGGWWLVVGLNLNFTVTVRSFTILYELSIAISDFARGVAQWGQYIRIFSPS